MSIEEEVAQALAEWHADRTVRSRGKWGCSREEPEWEYGISSGHGSVNYVGTRQRVDEWVQSFEKAGAPLNDGECIVCRRKVGPWAPVEQEGQSDA